jgi:hypothetical protein
MDEADTQEPPLSLLGLIRTLTAPSTLPHLAGFLAVVIALFVTVGSTEGRVPEVAAVFVGMGLAYAGIAMLAERPTVRKWVVSGEGRVTWALFGVLITPLAVGAVFSGAILIAVEAAGLRGAFPMVLAALFVAWSIGQGRSFRSAVVRWPTPALQADAREPPGSVAAAFRLSVTGALLFVVLVTQGTLAGTSILSASVSLFDVLLDQLALAAGLAGLLVIGEFLTAEGRRACGQDRWTSRMFSRWHVVALAFAAWHLGTAWRHMTSEQPQVATAIEEIFLMTVTVVMAVWSMTSRTRGSDLGLVRRSNALFWGLAFGYAYAGSVAMLSTVVQGVSLVLSIGHVVVAVTLLAMLKTTGPALAARHATALDHAAIGMRVEARLAEQAETEDDEGEPDEPTPPSPGEVDVEDDPVTVSDTQHHSAASEDVIELLD